MDAPLTESALSEVEGRQSADMNIMEFVARGDCFAKYGLAMTQTHTDISASISSASSAKLGVRSMVRIKIGL